MLKLRFGKFNRNNWKVCKCGDVEGYRRSVIPIVWKKKYCVGSSTKGYPTKIKRRNTNWIGHTLRINCLLKHNIEGKTEARTEGTGWRWRGRKQLLDGLKKKTVYYQLKEETLATCGKSDCMRPACSSFYTLGSLRRTWQNILGKLNPLSIFWFSSLFFYTPKCV